MGRKIGFLVIVAVFGLIASFNFYFNVNYNYSVFDVIEKTITGNVVADGDVDGGVYVKSNSEFVNKIVENATITGEVIFDDGSCSVDRVSWNRKSAGFGDTIRLNIIGNKNCDGHGVYAEFFEDDVFNDDFIAPFQGYFVGNNAHFDLKIDNRYFYLFDEDFEDGDIEFYASVRADSWDSSEKVVSKKISVSSNGFDVGLSPSTGTGEIGGESGGTDGPADILVPGSGWTGSTPIPAPIGTSSVAGYDATAIAHWDMVPFQDVITTMNVGVMAYHYNGIEKVSFSVNNGPWIDVTSRTLNPETNVEEYWVVLDASRFSTAGSVEIRAVAYPRTAGQVKVLQGTALIQQDSSMILNVDSANSLSRRIRYVSTGGIDGVNCGQSILTPCLTITAGINSVSLSGNLDGAELRLGAGTWQLPELSGITTTNRWFTIISDENTNKDDVIINGFSTQIGSGLNLKLVKLNDISLINPMRADNPLSGIDNYNDYFWLENSKAYYLGNIVPSGSCPAGSPFLGGYGHAGVFSGSYFTNVFINNTCTGPRSNTLIRNVYSEYSGDGHATGTHTVINYSAKRTQPSNGIPNTPGEYHGDVYQLWDATENIILYNLRNVPGGPFYGRGIVDSTPAVKDIVIDKVYIDPGFPGTYAGAEVGFAFSFCNNIDHLIVKDSNFVGPADWCGEAGGWSLVANPSSMKNILIENTMFEQNHWPNWLHFIPLPYPAPMGIRYVNAPITCTTGQTLLCPIQDGVCSGRQRTCAANGYFTECVYNNLSNYQQVETIINDGLDNDCDGVVDGGGVQQFDFSLSLNLASGSVSQGNYIESNVTATHVSGTASSVIFSASNLSAGITATFTPISCIPVAGTPCNSIMRLTANTTASIVTNQQVTVTGTSGAVSKQTIFSLTTTLSTPSVPSGLTAVAQSSTSMLLNW
ncbi:MAG: hypothetical protein AABX96_04245, partial [Nanoarchaeota archaeon]